MSDQPVVTAAITFPTAVRPFLTVGVCFSQAHKQSTAQAHAQLEKSIVDLSVQVGRGGRLYFCDCSASLYGGKS